MALLGAGCGDDSGSGGDDSGEASSEDASVALGSADDGVGSEVILYNRDAFFEQMTQIYLPPPEYHQAIKECMKAQGFDYLAPEPPEFLIPLSEMTALLQDVAALDPTSSRYRNRFGYGVSTVQAYLSGDPSLGQDPNEEVRDALSDTAQQAWWVALEGMEGGTFDADLDDEVVDGIETGGCITEAETAVGIDWHQDPEASLAHRETSQRIVASPQYVELEQGWARCAAEQGHEGMASLGDVYALLYDRLAEIQAPDPFASLTSEDAQSMGDEEWEELFAQQSRLYSLEDLAVVQQSELDLAQQLADCDRAYWTGWADLENQLVPNG